EATLDQVRRDLADRSIAYDAALASLELAALRLERGHASEARRLTQDLAPLFRAQRVPRDLLAALRLFVEALEAERATANTARELLRRLEREGLSGPVGREAEP
ncbi:MAG TPA: hypothetical protein VN851_17410, partial [Thermoanaerobaculia bacterium]|nr:hypothetical protein [Thermoanaerobaculia bacterium]